MEEDIKILEDFIKYFEAEVISRKYRRNISVTVGEDDIEALENLIKAYKELEKENKKLNNANKTYINCIQNITPVLMEDYIEKSLIKEKIEELKERADEDNLDDFIRIEVLEELIGDDK